MESNNLEILQLENGEYRTTLTDKFRNRKRYVAAKHVVTAAIPGTIISVLVKQGQEVKRGDALCILDSMKMNNIIFADGNGVVCDIHVKEGDVVGKDALMMEFAEQE